MSAPRPEDLDRDEALDAAWRAQSRELPPPSLDAAILAAAHREAHARPAPVGEGASVAQARKPPRAWWGLAAAATIGAIAFGVLQLQPREEPSTPAVVSDAPPPVQRESAPEQAPPPPPTVSAERANESAQPKRRDAVKAPSVPAAPAPQVSSPPPPVLVPQPETHVTKPIEAPTIAATAPPATDAASTASQPHAFPGSAAREEKAEARERGGRMSAAAPPAPAPESVGQAAGAMRRDDAARKQSAPLAMRTAVLPEAWVVRIEELMRAGRRDEAARELRAFRAAHADADERLPASLREWAATVKRD